MTPAASHRAAHDMKAGPDQPERRAVLALMGYQERSAGADSRLTGPRVDHPGRTQAATGPGCAPAKLSVDAAGEALRAVLELWGGRPAPG